MNRDDRGDRPPPELAGRTVILVDEGATVGETMVAAVRAVRLEDRPAWSSACPSPTAGTCEELGEIADEVVCQHTPRPLRSIAEWYDDFTLVPDDDADEALCDFRRFRTWMWRNTAIAEFVPWLREHDDGLPESAPKVGFYGLDLYSLHRSMHEVIAYLTTYTGTVTAASDWDGEPERKHVRRPLPGSWEELFNARGLTRALVDTGRTPGRRLERAIGVVYRPETERVSHYFHARLSAQFDAVINIDETHALAPLERTGAWETGEVPELYRWGPVARRRYRRSADVRHRRHRRHRRPPRPDRRAPLPRALPPPLRARPRARRAARDGGGPPPRRRAHREACRPGGPGEGRAPDAVPRPSGVRRSARDGDVLPDVPRALARDPARRRADRGRARLRGRGHLPLDRARDGRGRSPRRLITGRRSPFWQMARSPRRSHT